MADFAAMLQHAIRENEKRTDEKMRALEKRIRNRELYAQHAALHRAGGADPMPATGGVGGGSITVEEEDGAPTDAAVTIIKVPNGGLTDNGVGDVSLRYELEGAVATHAAAADPHTGYVLESLADAKGDLFGASANNTPAKVTAGANGTMPMYDSAQSNGILATNPAMMAWALGV